MKERVLELSKRKENTRTKESSTIVKFSLEEIKQHFEENLQQIYAMANVITDTNKLQYQDLILRSQVVMLESAFDYYLHEITKFGVQKMFDQEWEATEKYHHMQINMEMIEKLLTHAQPEKCFFEYINTHYAKTTMVSFESFKDQMNLIGLTPQMIANSVFYQKDSSEKPYDHLKRVIHELYYRRNCIAHQSDRKHENAQYYKISEEIVKQYIHNIETIVKEIHHQLTQRIETN